MPFLLVYNVKSQKIECLENQIIVCVVFQAPDIQTQVLYLFFLLNSVFFTSLDKGQNQPTSCTKGSIWPAT